MVLQVIKRESRQRVSEKKWKGCILISYGPRLHVALPRDLHQRLRAERDADEEDGEGGESFDNDLGRKVGCVEEGGISERLRFQSG